VPLSLMSESKAERGYHLLNGTGPDACKPPPVELQAGLGLPDAFGRLGQQVLDHLMVNQPATLRGDEQEGIHQMRVGIRRLRSLLVLFERHLEPHARDRFEEELRRLGHVLGAARDWDVFLAETLPRVRDKDGHSAGLDRLSATALECRHAAHQAAKKAVLETAFTRFVLAFWSWSLGADEALIGKARTLALEEAAAGMLTRLERKVERRLGDCDDSDPSSLHRLRKSAKKLRYGIEYLESLYGKDAKPYHKRCNALQKRLGDINDLTTLVDRAASLARERIDLAPAVGALADRSESLVQEELKGLHKRLRRFANESPFWA